MQLTVLGPMEVVSGSERLALGGPKQRLVLGMLAAAGQRTVTIDELVDGLWPEGPQAQPRKTVQVYITRLRRAFGDRADAIRSEAAGYRLDARALPTDADQFETDLDAVTAELDDEAAVALLRTALGRWRGDAFVDLRDCPAIVPVAVRLDEMRLRAMHDLFEREVRRTPRAVIGELEQAVEANPLHEGFAAQLMTAQYRAGRQADALATYQTLRRRLVDELGLEPGPAVRELEGRILRHEVAMPTRVVTAAFERQRRRVTVLSLDLSIDGGGSLDPEDELSAVAPIRQAARAQILHGGGLVLAEAGDGLTACFGFPARERSVEMAVRAALAIRDLGALAAAPAGRSLRIRVGVDTGVVVVESGNHAGGSAELVGIAGEPLRRATALRDDAAPGDVVVGPETAAAIRAAIELDTAEGATRARRVRDAASGDVPGLIGRESEVAELTTLVSSAGHCVSMAVVTGPPGVGKSALVDNVLDALDDPVSVVRIRCDRRQSVTPLHPFRAALPELFEGERDPSERAIVAALQARWSGLPALTVDDVDAADPSTLDVLGVLFDRLPNGLVVMTSRSSDPLRIGDSIVPAVPLGPLGRRAARRLASHVAGGTRLDLEVLNEIAERSEGIPLYVAALTRAALDRSGEPSSRGPTVPATLYDSLMADLDRLGPARASVQRCSVLGASFDAADTELLGGSAEVAPDHLAAAVAQGVFVDEGEGRLRFAHDLTASVAYESLLKADRSALHARVADAFPRDRARAEPERLASHLEAASRSFEAAVAWRRASAKSIAANRHAEAQQHARRAIALLDAIGPAAPDGGDNLRRSLVNLAVAVQATRHGSAELIEIIDRLHALGTDSVDPARAIVVGLIDVSNRQACGDFDEAERVAQRTLELAATIDEGSTTFARQFLGATRVWQGRLEKGGAELERAAEYWALADAPAGGASGRAFGALYSLLGLAAHFEDRAGDAAALFDKARARIPDDDGIGRCLVDGTRAMVEQLGGDVDAVLHQVEPLWPLAMDISSEFWLRWAQVLLGWALAAESDESAMANGLAMMTEVLDDAAATKQAVPYFAYLLASRLAEHGRHGEAIVRIDHGLAVAEATGERLWVPLLHLVRARVLVGAGRHADAASSLATAAALAEDRGQRWVARLCREHEDGHSR